jgi:signal transduction histidine kinase
MKEVNLSNRRLRMLMVAQVSWVALICVLGAWWGTLALKQASKIEELEIAAGQMSGVAHQHWERTQRMLYSESSVFFLLVLVSTAFIFWIYWRDMYRAKSIQSFFASVTHELRTPLTSIRLQAESIAESFSESSPERALISRLMEDTVRLEGQVERTLELARVEGGGPVYIQELQLRPWLDRVLPTMTGAYENRVQIQLNIDDLGVEADPAALRVIFKNMLENSVKHAKSDKVQIQIEAHGRDGFVDCTFSDDGEASPVELSRLGDLFYRGPTSQGTGVGLYLIETLMRKMGGKVSFSVGEKKGFVVQLKFIQEKTGA